MSLFHKHNWVETQNEFFPAEFEVTRMGGALSEDSKKLIFGYTRVTHCCDDCPQIKYKDYIGRVRTKTDNG